MKSTISIILQITGLVVLSAIACLYVIDLKEQVFRTEQEKMFLEFTQSRYKLITTEVTSVLAGPSIPSGNDYVEHEKTRTECFLLDTVDGHVWQYRDHFFSDADCYIKTKGFESVKIGDYITERTPLDSQPPTQN